MEDSNEINDLSNNPQKINESPNNKNKEQKNIIQIFFISCFNKNFYSNIKEFTSNNTEYPIITNEIQHQKESIYEYKIHSFIFDKDKEIPKKLSLNIILNDGKKLNCKDINIKYENPRFIFQTLEFANEIENIDYQKLNLNELFSIFFEFLDKYNTDTDNNNINLDEYKKYLNSNFIYHFNKKKNIKSVNFSLLIKLFLLSYNNENIIQFLDITKLDKINIEFDNFDKNKILDEILNDEKKIIENINNIGSKEENLNKRKKFINDYTNLLYNFIYIYYIIYADDKIPINENNSTQIEKTFKNLLNKQNDIIKYLDFIINHFQILAKINDIKNISGNLGGLYIFKLDKKFDVTNLDFIEKYNQIISLENKLFIDFSLIIEKCIDNFQNNLTSLKKIYVAFKNELNYLQKIKLYKKLRTKIHDLGIKLYTEGKLKNEDLINFLSYDEFYTTDADLKKKEKDIYILEGIDITSKNSPLINILFENKIYIYFKNLEHKYLEIFTKKIKHINDFSAFFSLLPDNNFTHESTILLFNWIKNNIKTFSVEKCLNFKEDINHFIAIMIEYVDESIEDLIYFFNFKLGDFCNELYIYILNNNKNIKQKIKDRLINYYIKERNINYELVKYFVANLQKKENDILNIFYDKIKEYIINYKDFCTKEKTIKYKIFKLLLSHKADFIDNRNNDFIKNTNDKCIDIINSIKNKDLIYKDINNQDYIFLDKNIFIQRFKDILLFVNENIEENNINIIYDEIYKIYSQWKFKIGQLMLLSDYYNTFFIYSFSEEKKKLKISIANLKNSKLNNLSMNNPKNEYEKYKNELEESLLKLSLYRNSYIFKTIYDYNKRKEKNELDLLNESFSNFLKAIAILNTDTEEIQNNQYIHFFIELGEKDFQNINSEIDTIIKECKLNIIEANKQKLLYALYLLTQKNNLKHIILSILSLIALFSNNNSISRKNSIMSIIEEKEKDNLFINQINDFRKLLNDSIQISPSKIKSIMDFLEKKFTQINFNNNVFKEKLLPFFIEYDKNPDSLKFLKNIIKLENAHYMRDFLYEENEISNQDIDELMKAKIFLDKIEDGENPEKLIKEIIEGILDETKCGKSLTKVLKKLDKFQRFLEQINLGEKGFISKIDKILEMSCFIINRTTDNFQLIIKYQKKMQNENIINNYKEIEINEHDFDILYMRTITSNITDNIKNNIEIFKNIYKQIKRLLKIINKLYRKYGYPIKETIYIYCKNKINFSCSYEMKKYNINELYDYFSNIKNECKNKYIDVIKKYKEINLFYGKQLYLINSYLKEKKYDQIKDLVKSVSNGLIKKFDDKFNHKNNIVEKYNDMINSIHEYINLQLNYNRQNLDGIFKENQIIDKKFKNKGGIFYYLYDKDVELFLLNYIIAITGKLPSSNNLLICNKDTSFEEIQSIINKALYLGNNNFFVIAKSELLNTHHKRKLLTLLKEKSSLNFNNILLIIFSQNDSNFHKSISKIEKISSLDLKNLKSASDIKNFFKNAEIIDSVGCGYGKTTYILENKGIIIHFPIGGDLNKKYLEERIEKEIPNTSNLEKCILYINIGQTKDIEILNEFLFKLLIFKKCDFNHNTKYFGPNVIIKIEIPNDFIDYINHFKYLEFFPKFKITDMKRLNLSQNIKIVATFLSKFKNNEIYKSNINIETDCDQSQASCDKLINEYIKQNIKNPNFYQKNIFVKILQTEFKFFNDCFGLKPKQLILSGNKLKLRNFIINSLINVTRHFTIGPYEDLIKAQDRTKSYMKLSKENKELYLYDYEALQIENIKYDDIKPSLITFNKDGNSLTIITTSDENSEEYKYLQKLFNSQNIEYLKKYGLDLSKIYINSLIKHSIALKGKQTDKLIKDNNKNLKDRENSNLIIDRIYNEFYGENNDNIIDNKRKPSLNKSEIYLELKEINNKNKNNDNNDIIKNNEDEEIPKLKQIKYWNDKEILDQLLIFLNVNGLNDAQIKDIVGNYIYTQDNFIKVILILMRLRSKVPVIMMGETGCGKTALIRMAYNLINKNRNPMKILNIHSGINDKDIIDFIEKIRKQVEEEDMILLEEKKADYDNIKEDDKILYEKSISREEQFNLYEREIKSRKIWIFFDEINTCNSMGLLSEIFCQNSIRGKPIEERFVFIGACNPYRILSKENLIDAVLYHKNSVKKKLVYSVNPLPHSLLNFVFNFGNLKNDDEKKYIESMIREPTQSLFDLNSHNLINNDEEKFEKLMKVQIELISCCQIYMKEKNDVSIVSLREVHRFNIFFKFFISYINQRNKYELEQNNEKENEIIYFYQDKDKYDIYLCAINLSLYICYYLRLPDKTTRKELEEIINSKNLFNRGFLYLPKMESTYLINNLKIENGIAKNNILKENLFASFFCVINKIPLIICGKPGRGKTLSIEILKDSLQGKELSESYICKLFNGLITKKIQGSTSITSKIITDNFDIARKEQRRNENKLVLVVMDEMGLAELSDNNPLKVTHYELEKEENKVSFVGISNWALDASKMNRVIYIIGQEPDKNSLLETAKEIVHNYEIEKKKNYYEKFKIIFDNLSLAYFNYIENKKRNNDKNSFFHGSRDFYSLIKTTMNDIIEEKINIDKLELNDPFIRKELDLICLRNIERNFGGLQNSINEFKQELAKINNDIMNYDKESSYNIMSCIKKNLCSDNCRYLLMIFDNNVTKDIMNYMIDEIINFKYEEKIDKNKINLKNEDEDDFDDNEIKEEILDNNKMMKQKEKIYLIGSKFKNDKNDILYSDDMLQQVKFQMEKNIILILKDLEIIYPALYELFNQNLKEFEGKKYTRLGGLENQIYVNNNFKTIVYMNKENIPESDPPFLNRFEKHLVSITNILEKKYIEIADDIYNVLSEIISFKLDNQNKNNKLMLNKNIKFIDKDEVSGLVYISIKKGKKEKNKIIEYILEKIVPTFTEDMIVYIQKFDFRTKQGFYYEHIMKIFRDNYKYNLLSYLKNINHQISIVYTFSSIDDKLIENEMREKDFMKSIFEIILYPINSINILDEKIINFLAEPEKNICIIKLRKEELDKLENIINLIEGKKTNKKFIILIHLSRTISRENNKNLEQNNFKVNSKCVSFLSPIYQIFIDNINNQNKFFNDILDSPNEDTIFKIFPLSQLYNKFENCFRYFSYKIIGNDKIDSKNYISDIIKEIKDNDHLKELLKISIQSLTNNDNNYLSSIFNECLIKENDIDFLESLKLFLDEKIEEYIRKLIYLFDKNQIFNSIILNKKLFNSEIITNYLNNFAQNINNENLNKIALDGINIHNKKEQEIFYGLKIPFIKQILQNNIFQCIENYISKEYMDYEKSLMNSKLFKENKEKIKKFENIIKNEINNHKIIIDILQSNDNLLIENIFHDALYAFLIKHKIFINMENSIELLKILIKFRINPIIIDQDSKEDLNLELDSALTEFIINNTLMNDFDCNSNIIENENERQLNINEIQKFNFIETFGKIMNFIESYSKEILYILNIFNSIKDGNLISKMKKSLNNKEILMDDERNNSSDLKKLKCGFFYIIESLLKNISNSPEPYLIYEKIQIFVPNILKIEKIFLLYSKEIFILEIIYKIISFYKSSKSRNLKQVNILIYKIIKHQSLIKSRDYNEAFNNLIEIKNKLGDIKNNSEESINLLNEIILNQYKIVRDPLFRANLIENILLTEEENEKINLYMFLRELINKPENLEVIKAFDYFDDIIKKKKTFEDYKIKFMKKYRKLVLFYLENIIEKYFKDIKNEKKEKDKYQNLLEKSSLTYLNKSIELLNNNTIKNEFINLYTIAYIKRYIINYIDVIFSKNINHISQIEKINKILLKNSTIKLFIFKLYLFKCNNDLTKLWKLDIQNSDKNAQSISIIFNSKDFDELINEKESFIPYYYSYPSLEKEKKNIFNFLINNNDKFFLSKEYKQYLHLIKDKKIIDDLEIENLYNLTLEHKYKYDILYTYFSYFLPIFAIFKEDNNSNFYDNLQLTFNKFFKKDNKDNINDISSEFLINNKNRFNKILENISEKKNILNMKNLEIIFYAYRFYFNVLTSKNNRNFYFYLVTKFNQMINSSFIPGMFYGKLDDSITKLKNILAKNPKYIMFICSCGEIYPYNLINQTIVCYNCLLKKEKKYNIFKNDYYGLVFSNENEKNKFSEKNKDIIVNECITIKNLEEILIKQKKLKDDFLNKYHEDDISYIRYRLLNFIFYGFIFYLNICGKIKQEELNNILVDSMSCFDIIKQDWELLDKELKNNGIPNVHIFLDNIFHKILSEMISKKIESQKDLNSFEKKIDEIISAEIKSKKSIINYIKNQNEFLDIKSNEILTIISEEYIYNESITKTIDENIYPSFKLFTYIKLPSIEDFENEFNYFSGNKTSYPIINAIIDDHSLIKYLKHLSKINEFCNYMINYCSYKFTRDKAKKTKIENEIKDKDDLIEDIKKIYDELRPFVTNYNTYNFEDKFISLQKENNLYLSDFCLDEIELGYGMVFASIYNKLIEWQNNFIENIEKSKNKIYEDFKELFTDEVMIQKCASSDIVDLPTKDELMENYILKNATSHNFGIVKYNFKLIEEELSENLLPKIKKFKSDKDKCLKFVIYKHESFLGNDDNNIITLFNKKYKRRKFSQEEMELILDYVLKSQYKGEENILDFWFALQILIDIILENNYNPNDTIINIINYNKQNENLKILRGLFEANKNFEGKKIFSVDALMSIFYQFEYFCWKYIKDNLDKKYLKDVDNIAKDEIINNLEKNKFNIISRNNLLKAIRRFISRYLFNKRSSNDIYEQNKLINFLNKRELWDNENGIDKINLEKELKTIFNGHIIYVEQSLKLYESLGEEEDEEYQEKSDKFSQIYNSIKSSIINLWAKKKPDENRISIKENIDLDSLNISNIKKRKSVKSNSDSEDSDESNSRSSIDNDNEEEEKNSRKSLESNSDDENKSESNRESYLSNSRDDSSK